MTTRSKNLLFWFIVIFGGIFLLANPLTQNLWFMQLEFIDPEINHKIAAKWEGKSNDFLLGKAGSLNDTYSSIATGILLNRKEKRLEPIELSMTKSWNSKRRSSAFETLGYLGDERAIEPLMQIVRQGRKGRDYVSAVDALSIMRYQPIYPELLKMVSDGFETSMVVDMLERFPEKPETITALKHLKETDPEWYIRDKATDAIKKLETSQVKLPESKAAK